MEEHSPGGVTGRVAQPVETNSTNHIGNASAHDAIVRRMSSCAACLQMCMALVWASVVGVVAVVRPEPAQNHRLGRTETVRTRPRRTSWHVRCPDRQHNPVTLNIACATATCDTIGTTEKRMRNTIRPRNRRQTTPKNPAIDPKHVSEIPRHLKTKTSNGSPACLGKTGLRANISGSNGEPIVGETSPPTKIMKLEPPTHMALNNCSSPKPRRKNERKQCCNK